MPLDQELPPPPDDGGDDTLAVKEAAGFALRNLEEQSAKADYGRSEQFKSHLMIGAICGFWILTALFLIAVFILAWHLLAPAGYTWLNAGSLAEIKALVGGVILSGALSSFARKYFK